MKYAAYALKHVRANRIRMFSTVLGLAVGIMLISTLRTLLAAIDYSLDNASAHRLITHNAVSLNFLLPLPYKARLQAVPGVRRVSPMTFFGGIYKDRRNAFANFAVDAEDFLGMYPEIGLAHDERAAFLQDRTGAIVGRELAARFGWKRGDTIPLQSAIPVFRRSAGPLVFTIQGIYDIDRSRSPAGNAAAMYFHFAYLREATGRQVSTMTYAVEIDDPNRAAAIGRAIDETFENTQAQTKTETEAAFAASFVSLAGEVGLLLNGIGLAVAFALLLVTANTMSMAVRERRTEIAVLKTLGFSGRHVLGFILSEALALGAAGGVLGVLLGWLLIKALKGAPVLGPVLAVYSGLGLTASAALTSLAAALVIALLAGALPALEAYRARITSLLKEI